MTIGLFADIPWHFWLQIYCAMLFVHWLPLLAYFSISRLGRSFPRLGLAIEAVNRRRRQETLLVTLLHAFGFDNDAM